MIPTSVRQPANNNGWYLSNILITENIKMLELEFSFLHDFHQLPAETTLWPLNKVRFSSVILILNIFQEPFFWVGGDKMLSPYMNFKSISKTIRICNAKRFIYMISGFRNLSIQTQRQIYILIFLYKDKKMGIHSAKKCIKLFNVYV